MPRLTFNPIGDSFLLVALLAAALVGVLWLVRVGMVTQTGRRRALLALRVATLMAVLFLLLRPTLVYTTRSKQAASLVILLDRSRSMTVADEPGGETRFARMLETLSSAEDELRDLAGDYDVELYTFAEGLQPLSWERQQSLPLPGEADGEQTAIGAALEQLQSRTAGKRVLGVILLSDGAQRALYPNDAAPQPVAARMRSLDEELYTIRFGRARAPEEMRDLAVEDIIVSDRVFVKNRLTVTSHLRATGFANRSVTVRLLFEDADGEMVPVAEQDVSFEEPDQRVPVRLSHVPEEPGQWKVTVAVEPDPAEMVATNNEQSTLVRVIEGGIRVLYLEGSLRAEQRFLRRSLDASPDINVDFVRLDLNDPGSRPAELAEWLGPGEYDVYLLGDVDSSLFREDELEALRDSVDEGAGLMMAGGFQSFGAGGYAETALAELMPIQMDRFERQDPDEPIRSDLHWPGPLQIQPTSLGQNHFVLLLAPTPSASRAVWQELPPLDGANRFSAVKANALVLATDEQDHPLLLAQSYGSGRVLAFAGDSTWRWWMHGYEREHKRFWRQVILWLAQKDDLRDTAVWVRLDQRRLPLGERIGFTVGANDPLGEPIEDAEFDVELTRPDGSTEELSVSRREGHWEGGYRRTDTPGDYTIRVQARQGEEIFGSDQSRFLVLDQDLELDRPAADAGLLASLAEMTGGETVPPEELPELIRRLNEATEELEVPLETRRTLWDTWWLLLLFTGAMTLEWFLRKRWGAV